MRHFFRARLHRRLFLWFGFTIVLMGVVTASVGQLVTDGPGWHGRAATIENFVAQRFAPVWDHPEERDKLARDISSVFSLTLVLKDNHGQELLRAGEGDCRSPWRDVRVELERRPKGELSYCFSPPGHSHRVGLLMLLLAGTTLWVGSGFVAHRLARPLRELTQVTRKIGDGDLGTRASIKRRRHRDEVGELAEAVNEMASRIQKQIRDQQELLAAVSHELRTPLGHLRLQLELMRDKGVTPERLDGAEEELLALDRLIGELLVHSRLEFAEPQRTALHVKDVGEQALKRSGIGPDVFEELTDNLEFQADPTMLSSAICNLLNNAKHHGGGVTCLRISLRQEQGHKSLVFAVEDQGPGFEAEKLGKVFEPFVAQAGKKRTNGSGLGLGLSLVERIARAHGGRAWAENISGEPGGARVSFSIPV